LMQLKNDAAKQAGFNVILEIDPNFKTVVPQVESDAPAEQELTKYSSGIYKKQFDLKEFPREQGSTYIQISPALAEVIFPGWKEKMNQQEVKQLPLSKGTISIDIKRDQQLKKCRNVLGIIQGELKDEIIVVGAHYDHLGKYDGYIWNGADDNGTGTIGMMAIARAFKESGIKPKRTIVFAAWTAEERGLLGSSYFVKSHPFPEYIKAYHNYDMIGREGNIEKRDMNVSFMYSGTWPIAEELLKSANKDYELGLNIRYSAMKNPAAGSDNASFARVDIPIMWFHTGGHPDYHGPLDHADKVNYEKMATIVKASYLTIWKLANE
ncbi:MAG: M20/M25/M40 family metallo-hydrolase, partial [Cytophagales bacterium]|nr:M20/M25/M40 family metallo-hydrolase [Cytophagales bacterium]